VNTATLSSSGNPIVGAYTQTASTALTGADAGNYSFGGFTSAANYAINKLALAGSVTAANKSYDSTNAAAITSRSLAGAVGGDAVSYTGGTATFSDQNVGVAKTVTATGLGLSGSDAGNYSVNTTAITTADITPATLTVTANNQSKTYGSTFTFAGTEFATSGMVGGETVGSATLSSAGAANTAHVAGSPYAITASAATGGTFTPANYTISYVNGALTVNPASLTVTANSQSKTYGQAISFAGTEFTTSALQNAETVGSATLTSSGAAATAHVTGSPYAITASAATGGTFTPSDYSITYVNGNLTVNPAVLTVTANNQVKTYGQTFTFTGTEFTPTGLQNSETVGSVTLASSGAAATAHVAGSPYAITASAATGGTFTPSDYAISYVPGALTVNTAALTVTANNQSKTYGQTFTFTGTEFTPTGLQNSETVGSATLNSAGAAATAHVVGSPYAITASAATGGTFTPGDYAISYVPGALTVNPASLTVTANNQSKTYGQTFTFTGTQFSTSGLQNGETVGSATLASAGAAATAHVVGSPYAITATAATGGTFTPSDYTITYNNGAMTVNPAALTVTANNQSKTYGQTFTFAGTEFTTSGLQNAETVGSATLTSSGAVSTAHVVGSPYAITASAATGGTFTPGDYAITYNNGAMTVNPAALTVTANNQSKSYGQTFTFAGTEFTPTGLQNGETVGSATLASAGAANTTNVAGSPYAITASAATGGTFAASDYTITYNNGAMTVNPAALTITADDKTRLPAVPNPPFTASYLGLQLGETPAVLSGTLVFTTPAVITSPPGAYTITPSGQSSTNYAITFVNGTLTVGQQTPSNTINAAGVDQMAALQKLGLDDATRTMPNCGTSGGASGGTALAAISVTVAGQCGVKAGASVGVSR